MNKVVKNIKEDIVSVCVVCKEDVSVLLTHQPENIASLPSASVTQSSWMLTAKQLISTISGLSGKEISLIRVGRFWQPDTAPVCHVIYRVKCPWSEKKVMKLHQSRSKWYSLEQVHQLRVSGQLTSPELYEYVTHSLEPSNFYPITGDPEVGKEGFVLLNEVLEKNVITDPEEGLTQQEQLLKAAHFTKNEQKRIYNEFLLLTFPNLLMNKVEFDKFMSDLGWKKEEWPGLFRCADESSRGGLTFREFLIFLAATEPETSHGGGSGKIRCDYIFRYFDKNNDNVLDQNELKALLAAIATAKGQSPKDLEKTVTELNMGPKLRLSFNTFVKKVGDLKFRGTSVLFRSKVSVLNVIPAINSNGDCETSSSSPTTGSQSNTNKKGFFPLALHWGENNHSSAVVDGVGKWDNKFANKEFEIGTHAIKLSRSGAIQDIKPVDKVAHGKSVSMGNQERFMRFASLQYYDEKTPVNELLRALQYFANASQTSSKAALQKKPLSWGSYDMNKFMTLLVNTCEACQKILEKEPRMLQLCSPVYVLGDLHGNYHDLNVYEQVFWSLGLSLSPCSLLFLGDYVDRGFYGVEVVAYLFAQKVKNPTKMFLLRGNHEVRNIQRNFTFYQECLRKFGEEQYHSIWNTINRVFDVMPLAAVVDSKLFCCHGGIPPPWLCPRIEHINSIPCPLVDVEEESLLAWDIMWNDPVKSDQVCFTIY